MKFAIASFLLLAATANAADDGAVAQVKRSARQLLEEQVAHAGLSDAAINLTVVPSSRPLPTCLQPLRIDTVDSRQARRMRFAATCSGSGGWRHEFVVRASMSASVLVAAVALPAGHELAAADVALAQRDITNVSDALASPQAVLGMSSRRAIRAGELVREGWLVRSTLVRRGAAVSIIARSGTIEVTAAGEALDAGARDVIIRVRNVSNGKIVRARVLAENMVEPVEISRAIP